MAVQEVDVNGWGGGSHLRLTASANPEKGTLMPCGSYPLDFFRPATLLVPISLSGSVSLSIDIDLEVPRLDVFDQAKIPFKVELPFSCLEDGNIEIRRKGKVSRGLGLLPVPGDGDLHLARQPPGLAPGAVRHRPASGSCISWRSPGLIDSIAVVGDA